MMSMIIPCCMFAGTFGQSNRWNLMKDVAESKRKNLLPMDLQRIASSATLGILSGSDPMWR